MKEKKCFKASLKAGSRVVGNNNYVNDNDHDDDDDDNDDDDDENRRSKKDSIHGLFTANFKITV